MLISEYVGKTCTKELAILLIRYGKPFEKLFQPVNAAPPLVSFWQVLKSGIF